MDVGVIDVGSNTTRLLVARAEPGGLEELETQKVRLSLGEEIERRGAVSDVHLAAAAKAVGQMAGLARRKRVASLDVFLTAPGRQAANSAELVKALSRAARVPARVLTKEEEGTLAYRGAILTADFELPSQVAVCDIGGASTELAIGDPAHDPSWVESVDLGSVRLTARPGDMSSEAGEAFAHLDPPPVEAALVVGGTARAARRLVGTELGEEELAEALQIVETTSPREVAREFGVDRARAEILPAGVILLAEVQRKLGVTLRVCGGGIREGAVLASLDALAA